ncbi:MAG: hypothetical protein ISS35_04245 [Kiritimatiellae bacterium]|nr:hypothetical protein [Kiritimatiellia bacterium]
MTNAEQESTPLDVVSRAASSSRFRQYGNLFAGSSSMLTVFRYELITSMLAGWPGIVGLALRRMFYRFIFERVGRNVTIGSHVSIRGARRLGLGDNVVIDDRCVLSAMRDEGHIQIGNNVFAGCNTIIRTRGRALTVGDGTRIGSNCIVATDSELTLGHDVLIGAYAYLCGGGSHNFDRKDVPILNQGCTERGGIVVGNGAWIGAHTTVLDGVNIGEGAIVGANSLVKTDLPPYSVSYGSPARVARSR